MKVPRKKIADIIARRALSKGFNKTQATSVAAYLLDEGRTGELDSLLRDVEEDWAEQGFVEVIATSAHELSAKVLQDIEVEVRKLYPNAKRIQVTPELDRSTVGGVRLVFANHRLDLSVASELQKFKTLAVQGKD
jgi:F0F1-type ATP synthase delta subunit